MVTDPKDRINVVLDSGTRALLDAIAAHYGHSNRSAAIRFIVKETATALKLSPPEKKRRSSKKTP